MVVEKFLPDRAVCDLIQSLDDAGLTRLLFSPEIRTDVTIHPYYCKKCREKIWPMVEKKKVEICARLQAMDPEAAVDLLEGPDCPPATVIHAFYCKVCAATLEPVQERRLGELTDRLSPEGRQRDYRAAEKISEEIEQGERDAAELDQILSKPGVADELLRMVDVFLTNMASEEDAHPTLSSFIARVTAPPSIRKTAMMANCKPETREFLRRFTLCVRQFGILFNHEGDAN